MSSGTAEHQDPVAELAEALDNLTAANDIRTIEQLRAFTKTMESMLPPPTTYPPVGRHDVIAIETEDGRSLPADVVVPEGDGPFPVVVYLHGGGWVLGSRDTYRSVTFGLAQAGYLVVAVDYALAPEDPFPAGFDDCTFAIRWAIDSAKAYGGDSTKLAIAGDSAGANLTAAVSAHFADDPTAPKPSAVLLYYGVYDMPNMPRGETESSAALCEEIIKAYVGDRTELLSDPRVSPIHAAHKLPPAFVVVGGADELVAQNQQMQQALAKAGVPHDYLEVADMPHAFMQLPVPQASATLQRSIEFLDSYLKA
jgi:acetyl esterase